MTTALAIRPKEQAIEFRRCTGHCCDPVTLSEPPGYFRQRVGRGVIGDVKWVDDNLVYLGWQAPSQGGWSPDGTFRYRCPHFDRERRLCAIYGQGRRTLMCRTHPEYSYGPWETCGNPDCTRRTVVLSIDGCPTRWRFPDLWEADLARWEQWERDACRPEWGPEAMPEGSED